MEEIEAMASPEKEITRACYFLCYLVHETKTSTDLFPIKHNVLEKLFKSGHSSLTVNYVRRGDREIYHLSPEAKKKWNRRQAAINTTFDVPYPEMQGGIRGRLFRSLSFSHRSGPFPFLVLPAHSSGSVAGQKENPKRRFHYPQTVEYGLFQGKVITTSRKATMITLEQIKEELQQVLDAEITKKK